jgi:hypothetical protein
MAKADGPTDGGTHVRRNRSRAARRSRRSPGDGGDVHSVPPAPSSPKRAALRGYIAAWGEVMEGKAAVSLARDATFAAMIATMWAVCATASPIATIEGTNLIRALGTDRETLTLVPTGTSVEVGESGNGLYQVSWSGHDGYGSGLAQEQIAGPPAGGQAPPAPPQMGVDPSGARSARASACDGITIAALDRWRGKTRCQSRPSRAAVGEREPRRSCAGALA